MINSQNVINSEGGQSQCLKTSQRPNPGYEINADTMANTIFVTATWQEMFLLWNLKGKIKISVHANIYPKD